MPGPFDLPTLPMSPNYDNIMATIRSIGGLPNLTQGVVPQIEQMFGANGTAIAPDIKALRDQTNTQVADTQTDFMRRGLTGSSIEMGGPGGLDSVRAGGLDSEARFRAQNSQMLADILFKAMQGDINAATSLRTMIAQAMGEELGYNRDLDMFNRQMSNLNDQAGKDRNAQMWSSLISAGGSLGAGAISKYSDRRLKTHIKKIKSVEGIDIVSFRWGKKAKQVGIKSGENAVGVLAQQVQKVIPQAITIRDGFLSVDYNQLPYGVIESVVAEAGGLSA